MSPNGKLVAVGVGLLFGIPLAREIIKDVEPDPPPPRVVVIYDTDYVPDIAPPTRLDIVITHGDPKTRCDHGGGTLALVDRPGLDSLIICRGVDY